MNARAKAKMGPIPWPDIKERRLTTTKSGYYINHRLKIGVAGNLIEAISADSPFEGLHESQFEAVSEEQYENTVLDYRYEDGEWQQ